MNNVHKKISSATASFFISVAKGTTSVVQSMIIMGEPEIPKELLSKMTESKD